MIAAPAPLLATLAQAIPADTVYLAPVQTEGWRLWVDTLSGIAQIVIAVALLVLGTAAIAAALGARRAYRDAQRRVETLRVDLEPLLRGANLAGENVGRISTTAREEAERVQRALAAAQRRAEAAADAAELRVGEFNALLDVVQREAEELFIGTASTLRGARAGARAFGAAGARSRAEEPHALLDDLTDEGLTDDEVSDEELEEHIRRRDQARRRTR